MQDVAEFCRIKWDTVGSIARRVQLSLEKDQPSRFDNLEAIGIDETSYKKGHKYMTVVVDHKTGHLIWAKKGHGKEVLTSFFEELTEEQRGEIKHVSADAARWIADCIKDYCPNAERCTDPFHVVMWANDCLDEVRKSTVRQAKQDAAAGKKAERTTKKRGCQSPKVQSSEKPRELDPQSASTHGNADSDRQKTVSDVLVERGFAGCIQVLAR
jgi:transposase